MSELIPEDLPNGQSIVQEGIQIGKTIEVGVSAFCREKNVRSITDYKKNRAEKGLITWQMIMGLSSVDEQVEALKDIYAWGKETGIEIDIGQIIPDTRMGLPQDIRDNAPKGSSFMLDGLEDYVRIAQAAPIQLVCADSHIGSPASVENTINAIQTGVGYVGSFAQFTYNYPYFKDEVAQVIATIKAVGIMAEKKNDNLIVHSYMHSGIPGLFRDHASIVGYARLEKYIVEELCGARYSTGYGQLTSKLPIKIAMWLALHDTLKADHPGVTFIYGNTLEMTEHVGSNYAIAASEVIPFTIIEQTYRTAAAFLLVPAKEAIRVPTKNEIKDIFKVGQTARDKARDFERMLDFSYVNELRLLLLDKGKQFFENIKQGLSELGVDIKDPVQITLALRRLGAAKLEEMFHPGERDSSMPNGISPFLPTELMIMSVEAKDNALKEVYAEQLAGVVKNKTIVVGSTDWHAFALYVISSVLENLGAKVINGGVDLDPEEVLELAAEAATPYIIMTTHNGLCLDYGTHLMEVAKQRNQQVEVFMGGRLNAIVEGGTELIDVSDRLIKLGISPCKKMSEVIKKIANREEHAIF